MKQIPLNDEWKFTPTFHPEYIQSYPKEAADVRIPHTVKELPYHYFSEVETQLISSYQTTFFLKKNTFKEYVLAFDGVMESAEVYVNEQFLGLHKGGYTPFSFNITKHLVNGENKLFVKVDSTERPDIPPHGGIVDYLTYGGIYREVTLIEQPKNYIEYAMIDVEADTIHIKFNMHVHSPDSTVFRFVIKKQDDIIHQFEREYIIKPSIQINEDFHLERWTLENPVLYTIEIYNDKDLLYQSRFASRQIEYLSDGFYLNHEPVKLRGLNRHQSFPYVGYAMPSNAQRKDADILKYELGVNAVRSSHYPPSKYFLDRCDEIGLLVFEEIPGWQHIGNDDWKKLSKEHVKEMIIRDYNHPSVFMWGVRINESKDDNAFYMETNKIAHQLDKTRPTGGVRNFLDSNLIEDVFTYNDFVHSGENEGLTKKAKIIQSNKPYLVTEHNGHMFPTKPFDTELIRKEHAMRHYTVLSAMYQHNQITGAFGWCMFDYNTHKDFGSGDHICYHGVLDMYRNPKYAAHVYGSQADTIPYLEPLTDMTMGDIPGGILPPITVATNCDYVKFYVNDTLISTSYPDHHRYAGMPHPPIIIDDMIGNEIFENETKLSEKDRHTLKELLLAFVKYGYQLPIKYKLKMMFFMLRNKLNMNDAGEFYGKYIAKWGKNSLTYKFEGFINHKCVITKHKAPILKSKLVIHTDDDIVRESTTYETTRITVKHVDPFDNVLPYSKEIIDISVTGPIELIGPKQVSLLAGQISFWVKTKKESGDAVIRVKNDRFKTQIITLKINP